MRLKSLLLCGALFLPSLAPGLAQAQGDEVIVTVTREPLPVSKVAQAVDVLDDQTITEYQSLFLADLLAHTADLSLTRNGGPGEAASASIRGAGADHTLYLLDGVALNDPSQVAGGTNLGLLATGDAARVEVLRGPLSTLWGSGALGGVVSITSRAATRPLEGDIAVEGFDHYGSARAGVGGKSGHLNWRIFGSAIEDQGVSAFAGGTEKDGFDQQHLSGRIAYDFGATTVRAMAARTRSHNAYDGYAPPLYQFGDTGDHGATDTAQALVAIDNRFDGGQQTLSLAATGARRHDSFDDGTAFVARGRIASADYHATVRFGATRLLLGAGYQRDEMTTASPAPWDPNPAAKTVHASLASLYGQATRNLAGGAVIALSARHDEASSFGGQDIAQLSGVVPLGRWRLHASAGQGYKVPGLYQLYSDYGTASLKAERATTADAGADYHLDDGEVTLTVFSRHVRDLITFAYAGCLPEQIYGCYGNVTRARASGVELSTARTVGRWTLRANASWLRTRDGSGHRLAHTPDVMGSADIGFQATQRLSLGLGVRHAGRSFDDAANSVKLDGYTLVDLRGDLAVSDTVSLYGRVENAGDTRYFTAGGYGQTGRRVWVGVRAKVF